MINSSNDSINLGQYLVRTDGVYDLEASIEKFRDQASEFILLQSADEERVLNALTSLFTENPHATMNRAALTTLTLGSLGATAKNIAELTERVNSVLDNNDRFYAHKGAGHGYLDDRQYAVFQVTGKNPAQIRSEEKAAAKALKEAAKLAKSSQ